MFPLLSLTPARHCIKAFELNISDHGVHERNNTISGLNSALCVLYQHNTRLTSNGLLLLALLLLIFLIGKTIAALFRVVVQIKVLPVLVVMQVHLRLVSW